MKTPFWTVIIVALMMNSCNQKTEADLIIYNARVYTLDEDFTTTTSFAVQNGKILATGTDAAITGKYIASRMIDAEGRPVYPGFIDGHCHFYGYGLGLVRNADLTGTASFEEILRILEQYHKENPGAWIIGRGWDQNDWEIKEYPHNNILDELFPETPVVLTRIDGHAVLANSIALEKAGITVNREIEGGKIFQEKGRLTGILIDNAADSMKNAIPKPGPEQMKKALLVAQDNCFAAGLTSVVDAGLSFEVIQTIDSLHQAGDLKIRINAMISPNEENFCHFLEKGHYKTGRLHVNAVKLFADGALGSRGALMLEPYADDPGNDGLLMHKQDYYRDILKRAYELNYQVNTHCIGDSANRMMLHLYGEVLKGKNDRRWRIEHAQVIHPDDFQLFARYSIIPSIQSTHATSDMYWAGERLGPERIRGAYAYQELLQQNGWLVNGTDFPVENIYPVYTFYAAVARKDLKGWPEDGFQIENALTREEALKSMTIWAARGSFEETEKGSIEPGKLADFVILQEDIMKVPENEISGVQVWKTFLAGEPVFENGRME